MCVHSHADAPESSGAFFHDIGTGKCRKQAGRPRNALRASQAVHATDVMVNPSDRQVQKKAPKGFANNYFPEDLLGFNLSVFPGVFLLSRWRWSGCPVDSAIRFGPGLRAIMDILHRVKRKLYNCIYRQL